ncbi:MAG TPA: hypothetical protein VM847_21045 [Tahibacter sp.]|nr:hypothetical protein [Tahibacter sp.]
MIAPDDDAGRQYRDSRSMIGLSGVHRSSASGALKSAAAFQTRHRCADVAATRRGVLQPRAARP